MEKPAMYGKFHLLFVLSAWLISICLACRFKNVPEQKRVKVLGGIGWILIAAEVIKQLYLTFVINGGTYDWFHFPFQLCSMPMYLCAFLPFLRRKQKGVECFVFCFGLFAASFAFAYPQDMLNSDLFLLLHSFSYHGVMIFIAIWTAVSESFQWEDFKDAVNLFLVCALIAEAVNVIGHCAGGSPDMFYISPFTASTQPVFKNIAGMLGRPFEIVFYLLCIIGANTLIFYIYRIIVKRRTIIKGKR